MCVDCGGNLILKTCERCGNEFFVKYKNRFKANRFCSRSCLYDAQRGTSKFDRKTKAKSRTERRIKDEHGNEKRIYEHRLIFETHVRPLEFGEVIHHIDGNPFNNSVDNLQAVTQAEHLALHDYFRNTQTKEQEEKMIEDFKTFGW